MASLRGLLFGGIIGGAGGLFIGLLIGAVVMGGLTYLQTGGTNIPYNAEHWELAHAITVMDATVNQAMTVKHLATMEARWTPAVTYLTKNTTYTQSVWYFSLGDSNDVEVTMVIVGPAKDGHTYEINFGSHMGHDCLISGYGHTITWTEQSQRTGIMIVELP